MSKETIRSHLHTKALMYLELAKRANEHKGEQTAKLNRYFATKDPFANIRLFNTPDEITAKILKYDAIYSRVMRAYFNVLRRIIKLENITL